MPFSSPAKNLPVPLPAKRPLLASFSIRNFTLKQQKNQLFLPTIFKFFAPSQPRLLPNKFKNFSNLNFLSKLWHNNLNFRMFFFHQLHKFVCVNSACYRWKSVVKMVKHNLLWLDFFNDWKGIFCHTRSALVWPNQNVNILRYFCPLVKPRRAENQNLFPVKVHFKRNNDDALPKC